MRAVIQWLALAPILVLAGCSTSYHPPRPAGSGAALTADDQNLAEALAHYSQALISEVTLGETQASLRHFREAAACDPSNLPLSLKVVVDCMGRRDYTGAVSVLQQTARYHPKSVEIQLLLGTIYQTQERREDAARAFRAAIRMDPARPDGYVRLATLHVVGLDSHRALKVADEGFARVKDRDALLEFCESVGRIHLAAKDIPGALPFLTRILRYCPGNDGIRELVGRCYAVQGRDRAAVAEFEILLEKQPNSSQILLWLGEIYELNGDLRRAQEMFSRAVKGIPSDSLASLRLAAIQMVGQPEQGLATLKEAVVAYPGDMRIRVLLAVLYMRLDRCHEAVGEFARVAAMMERDEAVAKSVQPQFYYWYGEACELAGRKDEGERYVMKYLKANPDSGDALNYLAYLWAERGEHLDQAMNYIGRALKAEPRNGAYLDTLGWIYHKKGDDSSALKYLLLALKDTGDEPAILEHLGDVWYGLNQRGKAIRVWKKSVKMNPESLSVRAKLIKEGVAESDLPPVPSATSTHTHSLSK